MDFSQSVIDIISSGKMNAFPKKLPGIYADCETPTDKYFIENNIFY